MSPHRLALFGVAVVVGAFGCAGDTGEDVLPGTGGGNAGSSVGGRGGAGGGGNVGSSGSGGSGGSAGAAGATAGSGGSTGGSAGTTGAGGSAGSGGSAGGSAGGAGRGGAGGQGGTAGTSGTAGRGGTGGTSGTAGRGGTGGTTGAAGAGGGAAGRGGAGGGAAGRGGAGGTGGTAGGSANGCPLTNTVIGFATQNGSTTGGGSATPTVVTSASALSSALSGSAAVIEVQGTIAGNFNIPSNKTLIGACGGQATIQGHIGIGARTNVIVRNLRVVGLNCTDNADCQSGEDAVEIGQSSRVWIDHCDISDGSDGNLDIVNASDYVTVSYTKFWYRGRSGGHQFSNLIGNSDSSPGDVGHLRVTWHHNWWADKVVERQPRVRYGQVHLFNNLWTSSGNNYCIGVGANANILSENNVFISVSDPLETQSYSNGSSVAHAVGNIYTSTSGMTADLRGGSVFAPPYTVTMDAASSVEAAVRAGAGPK